MNTTFSNLLRFFVVIILQIFLCNNIHFLGFISPALYLFALLLLPLELPKSIQYLIGFFTGFIIDMFTHTMGVNAAAATIIMFLRPYWIRLINGRVSSEGVVRMEPGYKDFKWILMYVLFLSFIHQVFVVMLETCSFHNFGYTTLSIFCNAFFTAFVLICVEYIIYPIKRNR